MGSSLKSENMLAPAFVTFGYVEAIRNGEDASMVSFARKSVCQVLGWVKQSCDRGSSVCGLTGDSARLPAATWSHRHQPDA